MAIARTVWISPVFGWVQRRSLEEEIEQSYQRFQATNVFGLSVEQARSKVSEYEAKIKAGDVSSDKYILLSDGVSGPRWKRPDLAMDFALLNLAVAELAKKNHDRETSWAYLLTASRHLERIENEERRKAGRRGGKNLTEQISLTENTPNAAEKFKLLELMRNDTPDTVWKKKSVAALKFHKKVSAYSKEIWKEPKGGDETCKKSENTTVEIFPGVKIFILPSGKKLNDDAIQRSISTWICRYKEICSLYVSKSDDKKCKDCPNYSGIDKLR